MLCSTRIITVDSFKTAWPRIVSSGSCWCFQAGSPVQGLQVGSHFAMWVVTGHHRQDCRNKINFITEQICNWGKYLDKKMEISLSWRCVDSRYNAHKKCSERVPKDCTGNWKDGGDGDLGDDHDDHDLSIYLSIIVVLSLAVSWLLMKFPPPPKRKQIIIKIIFQTLKPGSNNWLTPRPNYTCFSII